MSANAIETLRKALSYNPHGPEIPLAAEADALAAVEALLEAAWEAAEAYPNLCAALAAAVRRVEAGQ